MRHNAFVGLRMPADISEAIASQARRAGKSRSAWLRGVLAEIIANCADAKPKGRAALIKDRQ